ncbi:ATPase domain protein [Trypanosoma rangeli]|uniref:ATPase domain protein n=1 Tax=Trypanosoma rangeli TaxID=5698 RepID=A0A3R7MBQ6_TRYRA|nr:ATPase domain protein [Trypanosoma rangeli]RNF12472.1 ATPase domain protein [Trypanosoma rangeli]|eukprot:RNF12472.1 ATPase domain protein [Trypanosoma rangeli]
MSVDGRILTDLRRVLSEARPIPFFFLVCGPAGSGKTVNLHAVRDGAAAYGMSVLHGVPPVEDELSSATTEWSVAKAQIFHVDYNALRCADTCASLTSETYPAGTIVLLDDIEAIDYLLRLQESSHRLEAMVRRLLRSPRCVLVTSATDTHHVPQWILEIWTPFTYKLQELTSSAARRLIRVFPAADNLLSCVTGESGDALVSCLRTQRELTLVLCHEQFTSHESRTTTSSALHFFGRASTVPPSASSAYGKLYGLDVVVERVETLVQLSMEREKLVGPKLLAALAPTTGILLHGPSGSGKTALASRFLASYPGRCFIVSCAALFSKYLGESEERLREAFLKARQYAPSVLVLDDVDVVGTSRGAFSDSGTGDGLNVAKRMLAALLCELDGLLDNNRVLVIATTNAPETLDSALLRQGRFETLIYVPPLSFEAAEEMARSFFARFDGATVAAVEELSRLVAGHAEGCAAASLKSFLREVFEQQQQHQEDEEDEDEKKRALKLRSSEEVNVLLPSKAMIYATLAGTTVLQRVTYEFSSF